MKWRNAMLIGSLLLLVFILFLLATGSPVLTAPLDSAGRFPAGNFLTWLGMLLLPLSIYLGFFTRPVAQDPRINIFRFGLLIALVLALLWGLVAYGLAGNWQFSFSSQAEGFVGSPRASAFFWYWNYLVAGWPIFVLLLYLVFRFLD